MGVVEDFHHLAELGFVVEIHFEEGGLCFLFGESCSLLLCILGLELDGVSPLSWTMSLFEKYRATLAFSLFRRFYVCWAYLALVDVMIWVLPIFNESFLLDQKKSYIRNKIFLEVR